MEIVEDMGFEGDYFVSLFWSANTTYDWNCELAVLFGMMLERTRPDVVVLAHGPSRAFWRLAGPTDAAQAGLVKSGIAEKRRQNRPGGQLGLRPEGRYALFSLGPGNLKDVSGPILRLVREIQDAGFAVLWACVPISMRDVELPATVQQLSTYPLACDLLFKELSPHVTGTLYHR